jgi:hypothetical protein
MHNANRIILKGHPCRMVCLNGIYPTISTLIRIDVIALEKRFDAFYEQGSNIIRLQVSKELLLRDPVESLCRL